MHPTDADDRAGHASGSVGDTAGRASAGAATAPPAPPPLAEVLTELAELRARETELHWRVQQLERKLETACDQVLRYRELLENAPDGYLVTDLRGIILDANHTICQLLNVTRSFLIGKPLPILVAAPDRAGFYARLGKLNRNPQDVAHWEVSFQPPRGAIKYVDLSLTVLGKGEYQPATLRWQVRDISAGKLAQLELHNHKEFAGRLLEMAQVLVLLLDAEGRIQFVNPHCLAVSGHERSQLLGRAWDEVLLDEAERPRLRAAWAEGRLFSPWSIFRGLRTREGLRRDVEWQCLPLTEMTQLTMAVLVVGRDVTELRQAQQKVVQMERLAAIGQMAAGLAHESRNALQRSQACLSMLRWRCGQDPQVLELVNRLQQAQDDLLRLYEGAREYAAPIHLDLNSCNLAVIWRGTWQALLEYAPQRDARLVEEVEGIDLNCVADRFRLGQVFRNLIENALAACPDPVQVTIACHETTLAGAAAVQIALRDNGPGFDAEQRQHLFEPFHTTKVKGSGLGMSITKRIVEAHGGEIAVSSRVPPGAEILITLPRRPDEQVVANPGSR